MEDFQRFSLLTFPQAFDGNSLTLNIVVLPRNQNPLVAAIDGEPALAGAPAFADAKLSFVARVVSGLAGLPGAVPALAPRKAPVVRPGSARSIFEALGEQFTITDKSAPNTELNLSAKRAPIPTSIERSVKKYLPVSYRSAFNFVAPRTPNARTDDAYHCAVRDAAPVPGFKRSPEAVSWGQVFATAMRQPLLATALGMVYTTRVPVDPADFASGGWLYVDLADDSDYKAQQAAEPRFVRRYAARIPVLEAGTPRSVFGAIQFPVTAVAPPGKYDELFIEAAAYDDGFAHIVHAFQPVSQSLLAEQSDGLHPTHELGIRLGWDDEQILVWYIRQLAADTSVGGGQRIDAPIGMFGYHIDVRHDVPAPGPWSSLNQVTGKVPLTVVNPVTGASIALGNFRDRELPFQVYPSQLDGDTTLEGKQLPRRPAHALYARTDIVRRILDHTASAWLDANVQSETFLDPANLGRVPSRTLVGAGVHVDIAAGLGLGVAVANLTDVRISELPLSPPPNPAVTRTPTAVADVAGFPLPGRSFYISADWSY